MIVDTDFSHLHLPEAIDALMAMVVHMCRLNCGNDFQPLSVKDEVRKDLSLDYIRYTNIEMTEIAFLLGYSEHSAFSRSFKRMTGMSPGEARALTVKN